MLTMANTRKTYKYSPASPEPQRICEYSPASPEPHRICEYSPASPDPEIVCECSSHDPEIVCESILESSEPSVIDELRSTFQFEDERISLLSNAFDDLTQGPLFEQNPEEFSNTTDMKRKNSELKADNISLKETNKFLSSYNNILLKENEKLRSDILLERRQSAYDICCMEREIDEMKLLMQADRKKLREELDRLKRKTFEILTQEPRPKKVLRRSLDEYLSSEDCL